MKRFLITGLLVLSACVFASESERLRASELPPLPEPVTNNAVVSVQSGDDEFIISFAGLGVGRGHADTLAVTYVF